MRERERGKEFKGERETIEDWRERRETEGKGQMTRKPKKGWAPPHADQLLVHSIEDGVPRIRFDI